MWMARRAPENLRREELGEKGRLETEEERVEGRETEREREVVYVCYTEALLVIDPI